MTPVDTIVTTLRGLVGQRIPGDDWRRTLAPAFDALLDQCPMGSRQACDVWWVREAVANRAALLCEVTAADVDRWELQLRAVGEGL